MKTTLPFMLGCNYWASNAGTDMWREFDTEAIAKDLDLLASHGVRYLRVFPNWRDFQPVIPVLGGGAALREYMLEGDRKPENAWYLDSEMMHRFRTFCDMCEERGLGLIVGLITGWMSGRLFLPVALLEKNPYTDTTALYFEQKFLTGFVTLMKDHAAIVAWDFGNECNCMAHCPDRMAADSWMAMVHNAVKAVDPVRPLISGFGYTAVADQAWTVHGQAENSDILSVHPYPFWHPNTDLAPVMSYKTLAYPSSQAMLYADIGGKPCFVEEVGTMGPMVCSDDNAALFMRMAVFSSYAVGSSGVLWWCANEQIGLKQPPYSYSMCEVELGMLDEKQEPKPVLKTVKACDEALAKLPYPFPTPKKDAVCLLTYGGAQNQLAYISFCLAQRAHLNLQFAFADDGIPDADTYFLPSVNGDRVMDKANYWALADKVKQGATLYISLDGGILAGFEQLTGMRVIDSEKGSASGSFVFRGETVRYARSRTCHLASVGAKVLAVDENDEPMLCEYTLGKGRVILLNFPLERMLMDQDHAFSCAYHLLYCYVGEAVLASHPLQSEEADLAIYTAQDEQGFYAVLLNYSDKPISIPAPKDGYSLAECLYGQKDVAMPYDACVLRYGKR